MENNTLNLLGLTLPRLQQLCADEGFPRFTARQLCDWLYRKRATAIDQMTNLSLRQRERLNAIAHIGRTAPLHCQQSADGTRKYLFPYSPGHRIETVFIPEDSSTGEAQGSRPRATLCVSCQAGCRMGCHFCATGQQGFHGHLTAGDILNQLFSIPEFEHLTNIVFMGMGEPMDNLDAILDATDILTSDWGLGWSPKRITVSTVGLLPGLKRFLDHSQCHLAVSLHNPVPHERQEIMPVQRAYPLREVIALLKTYDWSGQRRLSFEYTMFRHLNDDLEHARLLADLLRGLACRVNLIRFHSSPGMPFQTSDPATIRAFQDYLNRHGIVCTLRASRGEDIDAACGLLAGKER